jgi:hypothetical protein
MFDAVLQQWQREYRAVEVEGDGGVIGDDVGGVVSGCHGEHLIMDGVVVEKREKQLNERESSNEMQKGKMGYLRHSCPIWVRDCVVRTLGLSFLREYTSFAFGSTDTWRQLTGSIYGFQGYGNNLLRLDCSYANKFDIIYIYI